MIMDQQIKQNDGGFNQQNTNNNNQGKTNQTYDDKRNQSTYGEDINLDTPSEEEYGKRDNRNSNVDESNYVNTSDEERKNSQHQTVKNPDSNVNQNKR